MVLGTFENLLNGKCSFKPGKNFQCCPILKLIFEIREYYENEPKFNGVYSRNNLSKIKDGAYKINLDEYESTGTHWIALYVNDNNVTYFDRFGVKHILKEIKKIQRKQKYNKKYLQSTSIRFSNAWMLL